MTARAAGIAPPLTGPGLPPLRRAQPVPLTLTAGLLATATANTWGRIAHRFPAGAARDGHRD
jgi:hypothetical protein